MFGIGEFSRITGLTVKALRLYHEKGILVPARVDEESGYRYYGPDDAARARLIVRLRDLEFSLEEIREILRHADEGDILDTLEARRRELSGRIRRYQRAVRELRRIVGQEREARSIMDTASDAIEEKDLGPQLIAGVRMKGHYSDCGKGFAKIGKALGRHMTGKPFCLYYDGEYREGDADLEACVPLKREAAADGIDVRTLPGGRCVALLHRGPYETLGKSYERLLTHVREKGYEVVLPTREVYLKGPGMLLKGNPEKYLTEIQIPVR